MKSFSKWLTLCLLLLVKVASAQDEALQRIEAAKIAYITNRLNLTPEQATRFWPLYNDYNNKKKGLNRQLNQLFQEGNGSKLDKIQDNKQRITNLEGEYNDKFRSVISDNQVMELYKAEQMFNQMLLDRLKNK